MDDNREELKYDFELKPNYLVRFFNLPFTKQFNTCTIKHISPITNDTTIITLYLEDLKKLVKEMEKLKKK